MSTYKAQFRKSCLWALIFGAPLIFLMITVSLTTAYFAVQKLPHYKAWVVLAMCTVTPLACIWGGVAWWGKRKEYFGKYEVEFLSNRMKVRIHEEPEAVFDIPKDVTRVETVQGEPNVYFRNGRNETFVFNPHDLMNGESARDEYNTIVLNKASETTA